MNKVIELTDKTFKEEVLESKEIVLVDFWAPWCGPCRMMAPILDELVAELDGKVKITKLDVENPAHQALAMEYQIQSIPNMKVFKDGKVIREIIGFNAKEKLREEIEILL
ncbi:MAG: Thioredoxin [Candidatus Moranbacteria bacterium GW2011_GWC2_37_73]|nr:MAG: Thioredoxin [Parcubacteria group bacterium GW2011_GWC1_36_108]KKQ01199.1 MAG: Thioredoxin [Candidatus Moranbacteria bacterium GW2011_GWD1_36_198]KKQ02400.1 MAG: Thioredoxin [Candidatus Moranbacteria bacterium GW2011_GWD2_36_198]KKQ40067.1 MAG: Thioredoxin [Candidatus Moranbacteria bacterium GW2011_GWC2_37_73]HAR99537.1 thioredoxin [Candidatus Moranbacteria bacterium]